MHVGFIIRQITDNEIKHKCIYILEKDRIMFPKTGVLFFVESYEDTYGVFIDQDGFLRGLDEWFDKYPHRADDTLIIAKTADAYSLSSSSEIIQQIVNEKYENERVDQLTSTTEKCPNCQFKLEVAYEKEDRYVLKCARCGFTMVRKK